MAILSRSYTIRKELVFSLRYLLNCLRIPLNKKDRKNNIIKTINSILGLELKHDTPINDILFIPYHIEKDQYLIITDKEVDIIVNYEKPIDRFSLFNTYVVIKRYVNYKTNTSFPSIKRIMTITNIVSNNTVMKYIDILVELGLIRCEKGGYIVTENSIRRANNTYEII